jgi:hypothetical protein
MFQFAQEETMPSKAVGTGAVVAMSRALTDLLLSLAVAVMMAMLVRLTHPCGDAASAQSAAGAAAPTTPAAAR